MIHSELSTGYVVDEFEEADTEEVVLVGGAPDPLEPWDRLWAVYEDGAQCATGCPYYQAGVDQISRQQWRECSCPDPRFCPGCQDDVVPAFLRRQAE